MRLTSPRAGGHRHGDCGLQRPFTLSQLTSTLRLCHSSGLRPGTGPGGTRRGQWCRWPGGLPPRLGVSCTGAKTEGAAHSTHVATCVMPPSCDAVHLAAFGHGWRSVPSSSGASQAVVRVDCPVGHVKYRCSLAHAHPVPTCEEAALAVRHEHAHGRTPAAAATAAAKSSVSTCRTDDKQPCRVPLQRSGTTIVSCALAHNRTRQYDWWVHGAGQPRKGLQSQKQQHQSRSGEG